MGSQWEDKSKPHLNIVFVGHVDHGKSTTVGRLLLDSGHIEAHVIAVSYTHLTLPTIGEV